MGRCVGRALVASLVLVSGCGGGSSHSPASSSRSVPLEHRSATALSQLATASVRVPASDQDLLSGVGFGSVWVVDYAANELVRIDPARARVTGVARGVMQPCGAIAFGFGSVWVPLCGC
jgi:hypothetical protein